MKNESECLVCDKSPAINAYVTPQVRMEPLCDECMQLHIDGKWDVLYNKFVPHAIKQISAKESG